MKNSAASARESLDALQDAGELNAQRLRRPRRYWIMFAAMLSVFALIQYTTQWPPVLRFVAPTALMVVIAIIAAWKQPTAVRKIRLSGRMLLQIAGFAALAGVVGGISHALYAELGWWWIPLVAAVLLFGLVAGLGPLMDRSWARRASGFGA